MIRVVLDALPEPELPDLFAGGEIWLRAARAWASTQGMHVERWAIDQRVLIGGKWFAVVWNENTERWELHQ